MTNQLHRTKVLGESGAWTEADIPAERRPKPRCFVLDRAQDKTEVSGVGIVAEGVAFTDGTVAIRWLTDLSSTAIYASINDVIAIHGHQGSTEVRWLDSF